MKKLPVAAWFLVAAVSVALVHNAHAGKLRRLLYYNYPGDAITNLFTTNTTGIATFPTTPDAADYMPPVVGVVNPPFNAETVNDSGLDNYGALVEGYLTAPETGDYTFWIAADDEALFFMTTDSADPLNRSKTNLICSMPDWSNYREFNKFPEQQSAPISLEAGKTYYLQIIQKQGTGGDHINLGWQTPSGAIEQPMPAWHFQSFRDTNPMWPEQDAEVVLGPIIPRSTNPTAPDYQIYDGAEVVVYANVNLDPPLTYQWFRDDVAVPGGTQAYLRFRASMSHNNSQWKIVVNGVTESYPAPMFVVQDKPAILSAAVTPQNPMVVTVQYSEEVSPSTATALANYNLTPATTTIQSATLSQDGKTVTLRMANLLSPATAYTLNISGIQDLATPPNTMDPASFKFVVAEGAITFRHWDFRPTNLRQLRLWSDPNSTAPSYVNEWFKEERTINVSSYQFNLSPSLDNFMAQMIGYLTPPETGYYKFAISSDDQGILYLGTTDQRSSKREICNTTGSTGQWNIGAQLANQQSALIYLEAGKSYYIEGVYRDGTGGDGISVFWQTPSGPAMPSTGTAQATAQPFLIPATYLSTYANPPVSGAITYRIWDRVPSDLASLRNWAGGWYTYAQNKFSEERLITSSTYQWSLRQPYATNYLFNEYSAQIIGYLTAPETGQYQFGVSADDHAILYLGTTDQRSSRQEICNTTASTGQWNLGAQANQRSAAITLQAGQRYYIEAVYRDGTGGDGITLAWYTPSMAANFLSWPPPGTDQASVTPYLIPAGNLSTFSTNNFGYMALEQNLPATFNAPAGTRPVLSVAAKGSLPYTYQWLKDGTPIPGATTASYMLPHVQTADNNAAFSVVVSNDFSSVISVASTLTLAADPAAPTVVQVGSIYQQIVEVQLSEPVTAGTATDTGNYLLLTPAGGSVAVSAAVQDVNDGSRINLQTAAMPDGLMTLVVQNLADSSGKTMDPSTNLFHANNFVAVTNINNTQTYGVRAEGEHLYLTAGGSDIWGTADQCAFVYKDVSGNFDYQVQAIALPASDNWTKLGLMARNGTASNARNLFNAWTPYFGQNDFIAQVRDTTGASSSSANDSGTPLNTNLQGGQVGRPDVDFPAWLRLKRHGDVIHFYRSLDGINWTYWTFYDSSLSTEGALPAAMQIGVALTSHNTSLITEAHLASFSPVPALFDWTVQPTNTTVVENGTAYFYAVLNGNAPPYAFQWLKNGSPIQDATNTTLGLYPVSFCTDNNAQISLRVSDIFGQTITTSNATLTVIQDVEAPTVAFPTMPKINLTPNEVRLVFSEMMDPNSAQNPANYQITSVPGNAPLTVFSALLQPDGRTIALTTDAQTPGTIYKVVMNGLIDLACSPPNPLPANTTEYFFYGGGQDRFAQRADGYFIMEAEHYQRRNSGNNADWEFRDERPNYSSSGYMTVPTTGGTTGGTSISGDTGQGTGSSLEYDFVVTFPVTNYTVWVRGWVSTDQPAGNNDSVYIGLDGYLVYLGTPTETNANYSFMTTWGDANWDWRSDRNTGSDPFTITNLAPGPHTLILWSREDGLLVDKICLEPGIRSNAGNSAEPPPCTSNGGIGDLETRDWQIAPPAAPTIAITSPTQWQGFSPGANVPLSALVTGPTPIEVVEYFEGTNLVGSATSAPYSATWSAVPAGSYTIFARVTDVLGFQAVSASVDIFVDNTKPVVWAVGSLGGTGIGVYFDDVSGMDPVSATATANYVVNGGAVQVTDAILEPDYKAVLLTLGSTISGPFTVQISAVKDRANNVVDQTTLQSTVVGWAFDTDIGTPDTNNPALFIDPIQPGAAQAIGTDGFYVRSGGSDIWNAADGMHFVGRQVTGNFDVAVRVAALLAANTWTKAGLMVREDLAGGSRNHLIAVTPTNGQNLITMQWRPDPDVASVGIPGASRPMPSPIPNGWLRITCTDNVYSFLYGTNGTDWTELYMTNLALVTPPYPSTVYVGMAASSHDNGTTPTALTSAYFLDLSGLAAEAGILLTATVEGNNLVISWPEANIGMTLQTQANPITVGLNSNWTPVAGSTTTNRVYVPINPSQGTAFYRLAQ